jgi:dihydroxyacetone kinase DhaKLM complex PTS-EIIA-like component DhaM
VEAIRYIEQVLLMEGFEEEFLITNKPIIEGAVRAAVQVMNAKRDNAASA